MLITVEWCTPVSNMLHHVQKVLSGDLAREGIINSGSVLTILPLFENSDSVLVLYRMYI